ncbi:MAG: hypothetical protein M9895_04375 [Aquamicrobium sp.]|uniref:hypothetical protein n=1 Tax=Aquamicrobium sp. TaxID=1872579 RepID=UPI00349E57A3|nr:hypothetical protein [Aquamicrobium sp.]MCO5157947.1 hypothetical protein [Aquamicrobium sp.]
MNFTRQAAVDLAGKIQQREELLKLYETLSPARPDQGVGKCKLRVYAGPFEGHLEWVHADVPKLLVEELVASGELRAKVRAMIARFGRELRAAGISIEDADEVGEFKTC